MEIPFPTKAILKTVKNNISTFNKISSLINILKENIDNISNLLFNGLIEFKKTIFYR